MSDDLRGRIRTEGIGKSYDIFIRKMSKKIKLVEKPKKNGLSRAVKVVILCLSWYTASSASNIINKIVLNGMGLIALIK